MAKRDAVEKERTVGLYRKEKQVAEIENDFDYKSDEESVYNSFVHESKNMPPSIT